MPKTLRQEGPKDEKKLHCLSVAIDTGQTYPFDFFFPRSRGITAKRKRLELDPQRPELTRDGQDVIGNTAEIRWQQFLDEEHRARPEWIVRMRSVHAASCLRHRVVRISTNSLTSTGHGSMRYRPARRRGFMMSRKSHSQPMLAKNRGVSTCSPAT